MAGKGNTNIHRKSANDKGRYHNPNRNDVQCFHQKILLIKRMMQGLIAAERYAEIFCYKFFNYFAFY